MAGYIPAPFRDFNAYRDAAGHFRSHRGLGYHAWRGAGAFVRNPFAYTLAGALIYRAATDPYHWDNVRENIFGDPKSNGNPTYRQDPIVDPGEPNREDEHHHGGPNETDFERMPPQQRIRAPKSRGRNYTYRRWTSRRTGYGRSYGRRRGYGYGRYRRPYRRYRRYY